MRKNRALNPEEIAELDRFYREGGLRQMASPVIHYQDSSCPHPTCNHTLEWIDFRLELQGDPQGIGKPMVRAWWDGRGFAGRCPGCGRWIHFTILAMHALSDEEAGHYLQLPEHWHTIAQFA